MKLLPEGFRALLAPAAMLPAALPRLDAPPMVPAELAPMPGLRAAKDGWIEVCRNESSNDRCDNGSAHCDLLVC
jgi:hypothetical protein